MKRHLAIVVGLLLPVIPPATVAQAKETVRLGKLSCVVVNAGWVHPLDGRVDGPGRFRCSVEVSFGSKEPQRLPLTMTLEQAAEAATGKPIHVQSRLDLQLESGTAELDVPIPNDLNGCMPFSLTMQLGAQKKSKRLAPDCGEG
jgi:hypothetical protein